HPVLVAATVASGATVEVDIRLVPAPVQLSSVEVLGAAEPLAVDTRTGNQVFQQNEFHAAPTSTTSQILQQAIVGAARAPTGEVHIRGQHAEYTYYVDGVPVPSGISGSLNELFDPSVVNQIEFQTGGWDAAYGGKNAAIVNVTTKIPAGGFHLDLTGYGGSYSANGQGASASTNAGRWGLFFSGARQSTDMRQEPVVADTATGAPVNFHNSGTDYFGFGKVQYRPHAGDVMNLDLNWATTNFEVPYDSTGGLVLDAHQKDVNGFANLGWDHLFGEASGGEAPGELFTGLFYRHGSLLFTPGPNDPPSFIFYPDPTPYNLNEDRLFNTYGVKLDYTRHLSHEVAFMLGTLDSWTTGHESFVTTDSLGNHGPASNSDLSGHDIGVYAQTVLEPVESWELRVGVRYDAHTAPFAGTQDQLSPRVKLSFFPTPGTTLFAYYGRQFIPTNVEDLRAITDVADSGVVTQPTLPERDDFYEVGLAQRLSSFVVKLSGYYKRSSPGIDDNTVPGSAIVTSVNIDQVRVTGVELALEIRPAGPLSGYANFALNHAYGHGPITGGFFPADLPTGYFDLDHDQRISAVAAINYSPSRLYMNLSGIYGTGLTNGADPASCGCAYGTGLFDFNTGIHVTPSLILNASAGYTIPVGSSVIRPQVYVDNLLDHHYLLKGAFFSGASIGRPRTVQFRLNIAM
ncbi:MAG TPA: TonB-dependent receptor, partial [Gemmatimonadales bacterium]|nr:TonB-dependent receptor [Gemmatimonadales bacterium]